MKQIKLIVAGLAMISASAASSVASAQTGPSAFSYEGRLYDASTNLPSNHTVNLTLQVLHPTQVVPGVYCVIREEEVNGLDLSLTDGYFSVAVGVTGQLSGTDPGNSMATVFANSGTVSGFRTDNGAACSPSNTGGLSRLMRVVVTDVTAGNTVATLSPDVGIGATPYALAADSLQGFTPADLLILDSTAATSLNQAALGNIFSNANYAKLQSLLAGTSTQYMTSTAAAGSKIATSAGTVSSPVAGSMWVDTVSNQLMYHNGVSVVPVGAGGSGTVTSVTAGAGLSGGTITTTGTISLSNSGVSSGSYGGAGMLTSFTVDSYGRLTTAAASPLVASDITGGTLSASLLPIIPVSKGGTNSPTALNNNRMLVSSGSAIVEAPALTNGQIFIGQTGGAPLPANLTAGSGITITNSAGAITIASTLSAASVTGSALVSGNIWVGDGGNTAQEVAMSGDLTIANTGVATIATNAVTTAKIVAGAVTQAKLATNAVATTNLMDDNVTFAKLQNINTGKLLGRTTASAGDVEELSVAAPFVLSNGSLSLNVGPGLTVSGGSLFASGGAGITALNGLTGSTQNLTTSIGGTSPVFNSATTTHTLQIPMASSGGSITAGLISNSEYASFSNKLDKAGGTLTGPIAFGSGSASNPSVSVGLAGSGMYFSNTPSNRVAFSVTGTEYMHILSTGLVGIGTTNALAKLDVAGNFALSNSVANRYVFQVPVSAGSQSWIYPSNAGTAGYVLSTDGAGSLSWVAAGTIAGGTATSVTLTGDVSGSGTGSVPVTISNLSFTKLQNVTGGRLLGNSFGTLASIQEIWVGAGLSLSNGTLTASGGGYLPLTGGSLSGGLVAGSLTLAPGGYLKFADGSMMTTAAGTLGGGTMTVSGSPLAPGQIWVGNASGYATAVPATGDVSLSNSGYFGVSTVGGVSAGSIGSAISSMGSVNSPSSLVRRDVSGGFAAGTITATSLIASDLTVTDGVNKIAFKHPNSSNYVLQLPTTQGTAGMFMTAMGGGTLGWTSGGGGDFLRNGSLSMTGQFLAVGGTAAVPGIAFAGETSTGISRPSTATLGFSTGGAQRMFVDSVGYVGIGTTSAGAQLDVSTTGTTSARFAGSSTSNFVELRNWTGASLHNVLSFKGVGPTEWELGSDRTSANTHSFSLYDSTAGVDRLLANSAGLTLNSGTLTLNAGTGYVSLLGKVGVNKTAPTSPLDLNGGTVTISAPAFNSQSTAIANSGTIMANNMVLNVLPSITASVGTSYIGSFSQVNASTTNANGNATLVGMYGSANGSGASVASLIGGQGAASSSATTGTIPSIEGLVGKASHGVSSTVTNLIGLHADASQTTGAVTTMYGLKIDTAGTATNAKYGLYQSDAGAKNVFMGPVIAPNLQASMLVGSGLAGSTLTLSSTSHASRGVVVVDSPVVYPVDPTSNYVTGAPCSPTTPCVFLGASATSYADIAVSSNTDSPIGCIQAPAGGPGQILYLKINNNTGVGSWTPIQSNPASCGTGYAKILAPGTIPTIASNTAPTNFSMVHLIWDGNFWNVISIR